MTRIMGNLLQLVTQLCSVLGGCEVLVMDLHQEEGVLEYEFLTFEILRSKK